MSQQDIVEINVSNGINAVKAQKYLILAEQLRICVKGAGVKKIIVDHIPYQIFISFPVRLGYLAVSGQNCVYAGRHRGRKSF